MHVAKEFNWFLILVCKMNCLSPAIIWNYSLSFKLFETASGVLDIYMMWTGHDLDILVSIPIWEYFRSHWVYYWIFFRSCRVYFREKCRSCWIHILTLCWVPPPRTKWSNPLLYPTPGDKPAITKISPAI